MKEVYIMTFDYNFVTVVDVLDKARMKYGKNCRLELVNEHGTVLKTDTLIEKARSYKVNRQSR